MMTDIEIAKAAKPRHIREVAADLSIPEEAPEAEAPAVTETEEAAE